MLTARQVSVHQTTRDQVLRYLNLNAIPQDSYSINPGNGQDYHVYTAFTYSFSVKHTENTVAGGSRTGNHFSRTGYTQYFSQCVQYANDAAKEKNAFLGKVINNAIQYFVDNATYVIWKSEKFSYSYDCSTCGGRGEVTCSSCGGSGKKRCSSCGGAGYNTRYVTRTDSSGYSHTDYVRETCSGCAGSGRTTCWSCSGSGYTQCHRCSGHGFFTEYCQVFTEAAPSTAHCADETGLHQDILLRFLRGKRNNFFCNHFQPTLVSHSWDAGGTYTLRFTGSSTF